MWTKMPAGGAVGAVLGGPGDGRALKREFIVFLKENIGFSKARELLGGPGREGWAPSGALGGASGSWPGAVVCCPLWAGLLSLEPDGEIPP